MKTMDCVTLDTLIENHERVNLIDIRPKDEFREMHIPGARSLPFADLAATKAFRRYHRTIDQIYVVSDDRVRASLAAGILRASGYMNVLVVDGGMKAWIEQGFPVLRSAFAAKIATLFRATAALLGMAGIVLALSKILVPAAILICTGALLFKASLLVRASAYGTWKFTIPKSESAGWRGVDGIERAHAC